MTWVLVRTFLITPLVFVIAAPLLLALGLQAALGSQVSVQRR